MRKCFLHCPVWMSQPLVGKSIRQLFFKLKNLNFNPSTPVVQDYGINAWGGGGAGPECQEVIWKLTELWQFSAWGGLNSENWPCCGNFQPFFYLDFCSQAWCFRIIFRHGWGGVGILSKNKPSSSKINWSLDLAIWKSDTFDFRRPSRLNRGT